MKKVRWGIIAPGKIAHDFAHDFQFVKYGELKAVASRSQDRADSFAAQYGIAKAYGSYAELYADKDIDAIYVATPHTFHHENTTDALNNDKAVLCEKPFAVNESEVKLMIDKATEKNCFLMEAMWTRFLPVTLKVREWIADGKIGEVRSVAADFGFYSTIDPESRIFNIDLAGGALLDVGVYPIAYAAMILGNEPEDIVTTVSMGETGVDEQNASILKYQNGATAIVQSAVRLRTPHKALICGTEGRIEVPTFWQATTATLSVNGQEPETYDAPHKVNGYEYEAMEVGRCMRKGLMESPTMPHSDSVGIIRIMDAIRSQWGLVYPNDSRT